KLDRKALSSLPSVGETSNPSDAEAPHDATEAVVAAAFSRLAGRPVARNESFFTIGGDSIRAIAVVAQLRGAGFDASLRAVFEHRTVAELARSLRRSDQR